MTMHYTFAIRLAGSNVKGDMGVFETNSLVTFLAELSGAVCMFMAGDLGKNACIESVGLLGDDTGKVIEEILITSITDDQRTTMPDPKTYAKYTADSIGKCLDRIRALKATGSEKPFTELGPNDQRTISVISYGIRPN